MKTNLYKRLKALLPDDPVMTGQISAVFADGTALALDRSVQIHGAEQSQLFAKAGTKLWPAIRIDF